MGAGLFRTTAPSTWIPKGAQIGLDISSAAALTVPSGANIALIQILTQNARWRDDGTNPGASTGFQIAAGDSIVYPGDLTAIKLIEEGATAVCNVAYYQTTTDS